MFCEFLIVIYESNISLAFGNNLYLLYSESFQLPYFSIFRISYHFHSKKQLDKFMIIPSFTKAYTEV